jgi:hypothetical protein
MNNKRLTQLSDDELIALARNPDTPDHVSKAAFWEGMARLEKLAKKRHPKDCVCVDCERVGGDD